MSGSKNWFNLQKLLELFHTKFIFAQRQIDKSEIVELRGKLRLLREIDGA